ncbi:hypothetical protein K466DRAFT_276772 [Polyporus arcularius HHB13444]|uniref:Uncharacterized protein n=1 Tax=Polyporus arcularius HHB13444 TaxID=1314778 RepID=A0A5C3P0I8_9APHY|nr:hypothetical protein K466DRAFT_276772 [Polyporus arcularius HHB13444]
MATQPPQSLPSFAQAFGAPSLSRISDANNALPPIQSRASPFERNRRSPSQHDDHRQSMPHDRPTHPSRKRSHPDDSAAGDDNSPPSDDRRSPRSVRIKEETEYDALPSPTSRNPPPANPHLSPEQAAASPAPPPSAAKPSPSKKRRVTISGISHPINRSPASDAAKSISPVVMGLPIPRDDAAAIEQVRSMLSIKQQQKELIEQRRGSTAGIISVGTPPVSVNVVNAPPQGSQDRDERQQSSKSHPPARTGGRSPNAGAGSAAAAASRRSAAGNGLSATVNAPLPSRTLSPLARQASPPHHLSHRDAPPQTHILQPPPPPLPVSIAVPEQHIPANALPPPPISFARRRATRTLGGAKGKPADIMISPNADRMPPSIQSAPPIPRAGINQGGAFSRLSSMALPSLPPVLGPGQSTQRLTASRVPPTPTRLSMLRGPHTAGPSSTHLNVGSISGTGRSPPSATVPIATTLVPPTPSALANPNYTSERSAFLAPFESFYDALADSKTLKNWLGEQLQKSHNLTVTLQRQQEHLDELVAAAVERRVGPLHDEIHGLHRRIEELEYALHVQGGATAPRTSLAAVTQGPGAGYGSGSGTATGLKGKAKANGVPASSLVAESYTFPQVPEHHTHHHHHQQQQHQQQLRSGPPEQVRRALSPDRERERERDGDGRGSFPGSQGGSPVPFDVGRRLSVSAVRGEPRPVGQGRERGVLPPPPPPPQQPAGPAGGVSGWSAHGRPWSPRSARVSLPAAPSASGARHGHGQGHAGEKPGLVRRSSGYGYEESGAREPEGEG